MTKKNEMERIIYLEKKGFVKTASSVIKLEIITIVKKKEKKGYYLYN